MLGVPKWERWGPPPWDCACWPLKHAPPRHGLPNAVDVSQTLYVRISPKFDPSGPAFHGHSRALCCWNCSCVKLSLFCHSFVSYLTKCAYEMKWIVFKPCCYSFMAYTIHAKFEGNLWTAFKAALLTFFDNSVDTALQWRTACTVCGAEWLVYPRCQEVSGAMYVIVAAACQLRSQPWFVTHLSTTPSISICV